jgi:formylglycine-generating enzyme required for sulfatase activity
MAHYYLGESYSGLQQTDQAKAHLLKSLELGVKRDIAETARKQYVALARSAPVSMARSKGDGFVQVPGIGSSFRDCNQCPEMVILPVGQFMMGSPTDEADRYDNEGPQHSVRIAAPIAMAKFEVTFDEWDACVAAQACAHAADMGWGRGKRPVINVTYQQAVGYADWLSQKTGKKYRLPTEAEWEYAARAGSTTAHWWRRADKDSCDYANIADRRVKIKHKSKQIFDCDDGYPETAPAGRHKPNAFGLHDMLGNVWEWVADCYNAGYAVAPTDGSAWSAGDCSRRIFRGGSWYSNPGDVRLAQRDSDIETAAFNDLGFRLARSLP